MLSEHGFKDRASYLLQTCLCISLLPQKKLPGQPNKTSPSPPTALAFTPSQTALEQARAGSQHSIKIKTWGGPFP